MNTRRKTLALGVLITATLALATTQAMAAFTAKVDADTLTITGDGADNKLVLSAGSPDTLHVDVGADGTAEFTFDRSTFTAILVNAKGGDDEVVVVGNLLDEAITIRGGRGNDTLRGGAGAETFFAGGGDDFVDGNQGADTAYLGGGADRFQWDPGDGSDIVEGQGSTDVLDFNGSNIGEAVEVSADGARARFTRNIANIVMDLDGVEDVSYHALGGSDTAIVNDLAGTAVKSVEVDLNAIGGGGDAQADTVVANGTEGEDSVRFANSDALVVVDGLAAETRVLGGEEALDNVDVTTLGGTDTIAMAVGVFGSTPLNVDGGADADVATYSGTPADDSINVVSNGLEASTISAGTARFDTIAVESLAVRGLGGADTITGTGNLAPITALTMDGGAGDDNLRGGNGADVLLGGDGTDSVDGNQGLDLAVLGRGDDRFQWDPGDGNDTVEGQAGSDLLDFFGSNIGEVVEVSANGARARFTRNVANIVTDLDDVEDVTFRALGGADTVIVNDLAGTDVENVDADLSGVGGIGDGQPDAVIARGTDGADRVSLSSPGAFPIVSGLSAEVLVEGVEAANDTVNVETLGGADTITTGREVFGPESYNVDGGLGDDVTRYNGTDVADTIEVVSNGAEVSTLSALASRLDTTAVESLVVLGLAGTDTISAVGNLAPLTALTMDGGEDEDNLHGGNGPDLLIGGNGNDLVDGNQGLDRALMGSGDDRFQWDPGDGNDTIDGQAGTDVLDFFASNASEEIGISGDGGHLRVVRNVGNITMDSNNVEGLSVRAFGGSDRIVVDSLNGTDIDTVDIDLNAVGGAGDLQPDTVVTNGTDRRDRIQVSASGGQVLSEGLAGLLRIVGGEAANDTLLIQTLDGNDDVTVAPDVSDLINPVVDLGAGE